MRGTGGRVPGTCRVRGADSAAIRWRIVSGIANVGSPASGPDHVISPHKEGDGRYASSSPSPASAAV